MRIASTLERRLAEQWKSPDFRDNLKEWLGRSAKATEELLEHEEAANAVAVGLMRSILKDCFEADARYLTAQFFALKAVAIKD